jgi:hypothetical protein
MKKQKIKTNTKEIQGIIRNQFENLYSNKLKILEEMDKFLDTYDHTKLNQKYINNLNRSSYSIQWNWSSNKLFPKKEKWGYDGFTAKFYQTFKYDLLPTLLKFSSK